MTSSNGSIFRITGHLCGEFTGPGEFPTQRPVTRSFDVLFDLSLNKRLSKQSWGWWFETQSCPLWRHCNVAMLFAIIPNMKNRRFTYLLYSIIFVFNYQIDVNRARFNVRTGQYDFHYKVVRSSYLYIRNPYTWLYDFELISGFWTIGTYAGKIRILPNHFCENIC